MDPPAHVVGRGAVFVEHRHKRPTVSLIAQLYDHFPACHFEGCRNTPANHATKAAPKPPRDGFQSQPVIVPRATRRPAAVRRTGSTTVHNSSETTSE